MTAVATSLLPQEGDRENLPQPFSFPETRALLSKALVSENKQIGLIRGGRTLPSFPPRSNQLKIPN